MSTKTARYMEAWFATMEYSRYMQQNPTLHLFVDVDEFGPTCAKCGTTLQSSTYCPVSKPAIVSVLP